MHKKHLATKKTLNTSDWSSINNGSELRMTARCIFPKNEDQIVISLSRVHQVMGHDSKCAPFLMLFFFKNSWCRFTALGVVATDVEHTRTKG